MKNYLTETERLTLKHVLGFSEMKIAQFESLDLDSDTKQFIIFDMMLKLQEREQKKIPKQEKPKGFFRRLFG